MNPGHRPETQTRSSLLWAFLTATHAESGLVCSLPSFHEALTAGTCFLACLPLHRALLKGMGWDLLVSDPRVWLTQPGTEQMLS